MREAASSDFVLAADEVWRLQRGGDAECALFQRFCDDGHYNEPEGTRQGFYLVTPSGRLLGSANTRSVRRLRELMATALDAWRAMPAEERRLSSEDRAALEKLWRWVDEYPEDGLVVKVTSRDLPREPAAAEEESGSEDQRRGGRRRGRRWTEGAWNHDWLWFRKEECVSMLPAFEVGATQAMPDRLARRVVEIALVDNVRGQVPAFHADAVEEASLEFEVTRIDGDGRVHLDVRGETRADQQSSESRAESHPRGIETAIEGRAVWDPATERFAAFELVAEGTRWGAGRFNARRRDADHTPIGFVLRLEPEAPRVAPTNIWRYGWRAERR